MKAYSGLRFMSRPFQVVFSSRLALYDPAVSKHIPAYDSVLFVALISSLHTCIHPCIAFILVPFNILDSLQQ